MTKQEIYYRQCKFKSGNTVTTAWISEKGIKVGVRVRFKDREGVDPKKWWTVTDVGETRKKESDSSARSTHKPSVHL